MAGAVACLLAAGAVAQSGGGTARRAIPQIAGIAGVPVGFDTMERLETRLGPGIQKSGTMHSLTGGRGYTVSVAKLFL